MNSLIQIICIVSLWLFNIVNTSGYGQTSHTDEKLSIFIVLCSLVLSYYDKTTIKNIYLNYPYQILGIVLFFIVIPYIQGYSDGLHYLSCFFVVFCFSYFTPTQRVFVNSGIIIAILGLLAIYEYKYGFLSGWNDNAIAMIGLFSYLYYAISLFAKNKKKYTFLGYMITTIYLEEFLSMDSRSCMLAMILSIVAIFKQTYITKKLHKKNYLLYIFNFPLILALVVCWFSTTSYFQRLDLWSISQYDKPIFNGRDFLWNLGLEQLFDSYLLGMGVFRINYHNSAIACLAVFGLIGYLSWISCLINLIKIIKLFMNDIYIYGCICAFIIIFLQQSLELGFIVKSPNLLPYMIIGLGAGRARYLYNIYRNVTHNKYNNSSVQHI